MYRIVIFNKKKTRLLVRSRVLNIENYFSSFFFFLSIRPFGILYFSNIVSVKSDILEEIALFIIFLCDVLRLRLKRSEGAIFILNFLFISLVMLLLISAITLTSRKRIVPSSFNPFSEGLILAFNSKFLMSLYSSSVNLIIIAFFLPCYKFTVIKRRIPRSITINIIYG